MSLTRDGHSATAGLGNRVPTLTCPVESVKKQPLHATLAFVVTSLTNTPRTTLATPPTIMT